MDTIYFPRLVAGHRPWPEVAADESSVREKQGERQTGRSTLITIRTLYQLLHGFPWKLRSALVIRSGTEDGGDEGVDSTILSLKLRGDI